MQPLSNPNELQNLRGRPRNSTSIVLPQTIVLRAAAVAAVFIVATALAHVLFREGTAHLPGFALIDVDAEANIPTWYASLLLEITGVVAFAISTFDSAAQRTGWRGIALILLLMGMDEIASIHNLPTRRLAEIVGIHEGYLMNAWVIPASVLCLALGVIYLPFILRLPKWLRWALIGASVAYLIGAVGMEIVSSKFEYDAAGLNYDGATHYSLRFELAAVGEEVFEYLGSLAALAAMLKHASNLGASLTLRFDARPQLDAAGCEMEPAQPENAPKK